MNETHTGGGGGRGRGGKRVGVKPAVYGMDSAQVPRGGWTKQTTMLTA